MYTLYFPFRVVPGYHLNLEGEEYTTVGNLQFKLSTQKPYTILEVRGFEDENEAFNFIGHLWAGIRWAAVDQQTPLSAILEPRTVAFTDDPEEAAKNLAESFGGTSVEASVDGIADGMAPYIYPSDKNVKRLFIGDISVSQGRVARKFLDALVHGLKVTSSTSGIADDRLDTALDLYSASHAETSQGAKLLTLMTCLESIAMSVPKPKVAQDLMDRWESELRQEKLKHDATSIEFDGLDALERELSFRRDSSLRSRIWNLVYDSLRHSRGEAEAKKLAVRVREIYDQRSKVAHEGHIHIPKPELNAAVQDATGIVSDVLKEKIRKHE